MEILDFIKAIRESDEYMKTIFSQGSCYKFHLLLKKFYPNCAPVKNKEFDHIASHLNGVIYDISGVVEWEHSFMMVADIKKASTWSFAGNNFLVLGECSFCDEPILA